MAHALRSINRIIREALAAINVDEENQQLTFTCPDFIMDGINSRHIANFLQENPRAVNKLQFCCNEFSTEAVQHFRTYLRTTTNLGSIRLHGRLGHENGRMLLSSLQDNESVTYLRLEHVGLSSGAEGGAVISDLLQHNVTLKVFIFSKARFGIKGARALQPGLRANETVEKLTLSKCRLGDKGLSLLVDALEENSCILVLHLDGNRITAKGLPLVTRLLENQSLPLRVLNVGNNPGLLDNPESSQLFSTALAQNTMFAIHLDFCRSPASAVVALVQAAATNKQLQKLYVYDHVRIQAGQELEQLIEIIPTVSLVSLWINLDFTTEALVSSFHRNMSIRRLRSGEHGKAITDGPVFSILERNRLLHDSVRLAIDAIDVDEVEQYLEIRCGNLVIDEVNARHIADSLRVHPLAVNKLKICYAHLTTEAVEIFRGLFVDTSTLCEILLHGNLGNDKGARLLSGLHGNTSLTELVLFSVGLVGAGGGAILSELLRHVPHLKTLLCGGIHLGLEGIRMLQPGIRANQTVDMLGLQRCNLGHEGFSLIVDALEDNTTIAHLGLEGNNITSRDLPHVMRLLQHPSLLSIDFDSNPGWFDDDENSRLFSSALRNTNLKVLSLNMCRLPDHVVIGLFQAAANNHMLKRLCVYDRVQLQGPHLKQLLEIIAQLRNLQSLQINLDFTLESVLSSFRRNTSIFLLYRVENLARIFNGAVTDILKRNCCIYCANQLLQSEPRMTIPWGGVWAKAIEHLTVENQGATAAYKILQEKLIMWCAPETSSTTHDAIATASTTTTADAVAAPDSTLPPADDAGGCGVDAAAAADISSTSPINTGSLHAQISRKDEMEETSSTTTTTTTTTSANTISPTNKTATSEKRLRSQASMNNNNDDNADTSTVIDSQATAMNDKNDSETSAAAADDHDDDGDDDNDEPCPKRACT